MDPKKLEILRHSTSHVLAAAIYELFPDAKFGIGPAVENGFYYDLELPRTLIPEDLANLEAKMEEIIKANHRFERQEINRGKAIELFKKAKQTYKVELLKEMPDEEVSVYKTGRFVDLCRGPHLDSTGEIRAFKLTKIAGAYWKGDEKNKMLQRIYGVAFGDRKELAVYLHQQEEAKKRDHRKLGKELDLFVFSDLVGKGLPMFTEKGSIIRRELEKFTINEEIKRGYKHVYTPDLAKVELYKTSGHYPYYKDTMYPVMKIDEEELILRPMTCPHHFQLYASRPHTYKELPFRIAELAKQFRYEKSGELTGLMRVRSFCLADAHIICTKDQATSEINNVLDLIEYAAGVLGLKKGENYRYRLSLGDRADTKKYYKDDPAWDRAEEILRSVLKDRQAPFYEGAGEAAFYGPKIDIQMKSFAGKEDTAFTVQYDFVMPKRFDLKYIDAAGKKQEPIVIHRSSIGCIERVMAFLIEHYAGAFPLWLAPVQVKILPVASKFTAEAEKLAAQLRVENIRAEVDGANESVGKKIRQAQLEKVPYMIIFGEKEQQSGKVAVRSREQGDLGAKDIAVFVRELTKQIAQKS